MRSRRHFTDQLIGHMLYLTPPPDRSGRLNPPNCPSILLLLLLCVVNANLLLSCTLNAPLLLAAYKSPPVIPPPPQRPPVDHRFYDLQQITFR